MPDPSGSTTSPTPYPFQKTRSKLGDGNDHLRSSDFHMGGTDLNRTVTPHTFSYGYHVDTHQFNMHQLYVHNFIPLCQLFRRHENMGMDTNYTLLYMLYDWKYRSKRPNLSRNIIVTLERCNILTWYFGIEFQLYTYMKNMLDYAVFSELLRWMQLIINLRIYCSMLLDIYCIHLGTFQVKTGLHPHISHIEASFIYHASTRKPMTLYYNRILYDDINLVN